MNIIECKNLTKEYLSGENVVKAVDQKKFVKICR